MSMGGRMILKITHAAISEITNQAKDFMDEDKKPMIRLSMGIG